MGTRQLVSDQPPRASLSRECRSILLPLLLRCKIQLEPLTSGKKAVQCPLPDHEDRHPSAPSMRMAGSATSAAKATILQAGSVFVKGSSLCIPASARVRLSREPAQPQAASRAAVADPQGDAVDHLVHVVTSAARSWLPLPDERDAMIQAHAEARAREEDEACRGVQPIGAGGF